MAEINTSIWRGTTNVVRDNNQYAEMREFVLTDTMYDMMQEGLLEQNVILDNTNVYTSVDAEKHGLTHAGNVASLIRYNMTGSDDNPYAPPIASIDFENGGADYVNYRLCLIETVSASNNRQEPGNMIRWTGVKEGYNIGGSSEWHDAYTNTDKKYTYNPTDSVLGNRYLQHRFVTKFNPADIVLYVYNFIFMDEEGNTINVQYDEIKPPDNLPAGKEYEATSGRVWATGVLRRNDKEYRCIGAGIDNYFGTIAESTYMENTNQSYSNDASKRASNFVRINDTTTYCRVLPFIERIINGNRYVYTHPGFFFGQAKYNRGNWGNAMYGTAFFGSRAGQAQPNNCEAFSVASNTSQWLVHGRIYDDQTTASTVIAIGNYPDMTIEGEQLTGNQKLQNGVYGYYGNDFSFNNMVSIMGHVTTPKQIMHALACTLLPFTFNPSAATYASIEKCNDPNVYIGITREDGYAEGDWVQGEAVAEAPQIERGDLNDPEFKPYEPPAPPVSEEDEGDIPKGSLNFLFNVKGFTTQYIMSGLQINAMGASLWSGLQGYRPETENMIDNFNLLQLTNLDNYDISLTLSNVIDYFVSLRYYPIKDLQSLAQATSAGERGIRVGTGKTLISTEGTGNNFDPLIVGAPAFEFDGGTVAVPHTYNNYLDYEPNVHISCYVPYCGTVDLEPSEVIGRTLHLYYACDLMTGSLTALLYKEGEATYPLATLTGTIGFEIPITGSNYNSQMVNAITSMQRQAIGNWSQILGMGGDLVGAVAGGISGDVGGMASSIGNMATGAARIGMNGLNMKNSIPQMTGISPLVCGSSSSLGAFMLPQKAFIQIKRRHPAFQPTDSNYYKFIGKVASTYASIGSQKGFITCNSPKIGACSATADEKAEILQLLSSGIYV